MPDSISLKRVSDNTKGYAYIIESANDCPIYSVGDKFELYGHIFYPPVGKATCLTISCQLSQSCDNEEDNSMPLKCLGCGESSSISIKFHSSKRVTKKVAELIDQISGYSFFKILRRGDLIDISSELILRSYKSGEEILKRGEEGNSLYIILSGMVDVLGESGSVIATHSSGKIFGEISLLTGDACNATVIASSDIELVTMNLNTFKDMVHNFPKLQRYFFQLLAHRLDKTNMALVSSSAQIQGNLTDWKLPDLLQTINMNKKSGTLNIDLGNSVAEILFCNGEICSANYGTDSGLEAFYGIFNIKDAKFSFNVLDTHIDESELTPIGDFMNMMFEAIVRTDEAEASNQGLLGS
jgi:hypothetical protein